MKDHIISAIKGLWLNRWSTLMATMSIGICFFIFTALFLIIYNVEIFTKKLSTKASVVVYLKKEANSNDIASLTEDLKKLGVFSKLNYISKEDALKEMKSMIDPQLIELIGYNPLSDTIEAFVKEDSLNSVELIANKIKKLPFVEDVYYPVNIVKGINIMRITVLNFGVFILTLLSIAILFILYATVKSFYWKKTEEIEILKLLGATPSYIRLPFLMEGAIIGIGGTLFAEFCLVLIYFTLHSKNLYTFLPAISQIVFPLEVLYILPISGMFFGIISSFLALGRIKYQ